MVIAVVTSSRADWGLLEKVYNEISLRFGYQIEIIACGSHLAPSYGYTRNDIDIPRVEGVLTLIDSDSKEGDIKSAGLALIQFSNVFDRINPDCIILLGDRYETLAAAIAAHINRIPICHISGGEITSGSYDNAFRHSITKMASLHFVPTKLCRKRVVQLGEHPDTVFNVGSLGCDGLEYKNIPKNFILTIYHPETLGNDIALDNLLSVLNGMKEHLVIISPNADNGRWSILNKYGGLEIYNNLKRDKFIDYLKIAKVIVGNSSAGIVEAPAVGTPTINIGDRQAGREMADSIINCDGSKESIEQAFEKVFSPEFQRMMTECNYYRPYQGENVAQQIVDIIKRELPKVNLKKGFYDLP